MPCDSRRRKDETPEQRKTAVQLATERLEKALAIGEIKVKVGPQGSIVFAGWGEKERDGVTDLCAYRKLSAKGSAALRQAVARAEAISGTKVNERAIAAGLHSHDAGKTWGSH